jgi:hypothetical protein
MGVIAVLGGTGPEGFGLGLRFAQAGEQVRIGSRDEARARESAAKANAQLAAAGTRQHVEAAENSAAVEGADLVVFAFPYEGVASLVPSLAAKLSGKVVLEVVNPLEMLNGVFRMSAVAAGSAAEEIQGLLPESAVVSGFKNQSATELKDLSHPMRGDVIICGNHDDAKASVAALVRKVRDLRCVDAGALVNARALEAGTALLLNLNRRYKALTSIQLLGLDGRV